MNLPNHKYGLFLTHNEHLNYYDTAEQWLNDNSDRAPFATPEERQKAIDTNSIWVLQWYPHTPVGFRIIAGATLEEVLARSTEV